MEYLFIYLLQMAENLDWIGFILVFTTISSLGFLIVMAVQSECKFENTEHHTYEMSNECIKTASKLAKKIFAINLICVFITMILPTKQTLLLVGGTYLGKKAVNKVITSDKLNKVNTIIELELDKRIKELKGGN